MGREVFCAICGGCLRPKLPLAIESCRPLQRWHPDVETHLENARANMHGYRGFDPQVVNDENGAWQQDIRMLGYNPDAQGVGKAFLSGRVESASFTVFREIEYGEDPNQPVQIDEFRTYDPFPRHHPPSFPIHEICLEFFTRFSSMEYNLDKLDKDNLYHAMTDLSRDSDHTCLAIDYGEPAYGDRGGKWIGEEILATNPLEMPTFTRLLRSTLSTDSFALPLPRPLPTRIHHDPFTTLPYDLHHAILLLLPSHSVLALATASHPIHASISRRADNQPFWKRALVSCMPWFWELHALLRHGTVDAETTDHRGLFLWLDAQTAPRRWVRGPWMGIANRRRVWGVCEQIAGAPGGYARRAVVAQRGRERAAGVGEFAEGMWRVGVNLDLAGVAWPVPERGVGAVTTQWFCGLEEMGRGGVMEAVWDGEGELVGLVWTVDGGEARVFGSEEGKREAATIEAGDEVRGLVLHMPDMLAGGCRDARTAIKGITVRCILYDVLPAQADSQNPPQLHTTDTTTTKTLGDTNPTHSQRLLPLAGDDYTLIGLTGHLTTQNPLRLLRLGLIQAHRPNLTNACDPNPNPHTLRIRGRLPAPAPLLHRTLWKPPTHTNANPLHSPAAPIWTHHPRVRARARPACWEGVEDVAAAEALVWGAGERERRALRRVVACQLVGDGRVVGLRAELEGGGERVVWRPGEEGEWREVMLEVDGAGGEEVVGVEVARGGWPLVVEAVKLRTNFGQAVVWGVAGSGSFEPVASERDGPILGVAVAFACCHGDHHGREGSELGHSITMAWVSALVEKESWKGY